MAREALGFLTEIWGYMDWDPGGRNGYQWEVPGLGMSPCLVTNGL